MGKELIDLIIIFPQFANATCVRNSNHSSGESYYHEALKFV